MSNTRLSTLASVNRPPPRLFLADSAPRSGLSRLLLRSAGVVAGPERRLAAVEAEAVGRDSRCPSSKSRPCWVARFSQRDSVERSGGSSSTGQRSRKVGESRKDGRRQAGRCQAGPALRRQTRRSRRPTATPPCSPTLRPCRAGKATSGQIRGRFVLI